MDGSWSHAESPFHAGEQQVQERLGVRDKIEPFARRVIRDHLPDQHRAFYGELPFVVIGTVDERGRPWASLVAGRPGFMTSADPRRLDIAARPLAGDPLNATLRPGADVGILGIQLETRRRNRLTGRIDSVGDDGFAVATDQTFGNCPQYIQSRAVEILPEIDAPATERPIRRSDRFDDHTRALIERADTLFIATAYTESLDAASQGGDVSHRGGKPGFVRIEDDWTFVFPDFSGNNHFNTVGNILLNPRAGFLFVDFETRDLVYMTGAADIVWEGAEVQAFVGAERLIRFRAEEVIRVDGSLPLRFAFGGYAPMLERTGSWAQTAETIAAEQERNVYVPYEIFDVRPESEAITSFYLRRADGKAPASYEPGQFLPIRLAIPREDAPARRTYTISDAPNGGHYRLSIKREGGTALVSNFLHDHAKSGFHLEAMAPRGKFILDQSSDRPVVLISGGVGITPMIAMTNFIINEGLRTRNFRRTYFIHGARNGQVLAFNNHIRELAAKHDSLSAHIRFSHPSETDRLGETHDSEGHVDIELLKRLLPFDEYDFYLCGPPPFMQALHDGLTELGVRAERIHYESFGPATVLRHDAAPKEPPAKGRPVGGPVTVRFADSDVEATWTPDKGTVLELAEAAALNPDFACRSGICGTCATRIKCGTVDYLEEPSAPHGDDEVLICCATPRSTAGETSCGEDRGVVLAL
jgi:ferredoxin-NADP reductase/predicted pyridoxine 5'-phosphate oxidase superfamily flavin-nucleotide-binding protein